MFDESSGGTGGNAGDAGVSSAGSSNGDGGGGGGAGTLTGGGAGGEDCFERESGPWSGTAGSFGLGGNGGESFGFPFTGGGGGGGGYTGGGGGAGSCEPGPEAVAVVAAVAPTSSSAARPSTRSARPRRQPPPSITISYPSPATATLEETSLTFPGTQPQQTVSAPQTLTIANEGGNPAVDHGHDLRRLGLPADQRPSRRLPDRLIELSGPGGLRSHLSADSAFRAPGRRYPHSEPSDRQQRRRGHERGRALRHGRIAAAGSSRGDRSCRSARIARARRVLLVPPGPRERRAPMALPARQDRLASRVRAERRGRPVPQGRRVRPGQPASKDPRGRRRSTSAIAVAAMGAFRSPVTCVCSVARRRSPARRCDAAVSSMRPHRPARCLPASRSC